MRVRSELGRLLSVVVLSIVIVIVGFSICPSPSRGRTIHDEGRGVLSASSGFGGNSIYPPPPPPWTATFGTLILCVRQQGERVRIEGVRTEMGGKALKTRHVLRVVPPARYRPSGFSWVPFGSSMRAFPFREGETVPYGGAVRRVEGAVVSQTCASARDARVNGYTDLLTELTVDRRGAEVKRTMIDYTSRSKRYTLVVHWQMTACGILILEHCGRSGRDRLTEP